MSPQPAATLLHYSACRLCAHHREQGVELVCQHPQLLDMGAPQPVAVVRAWAGGCGPNATHMQAAYAGHGSAA